jgi:hypothetical protein
LPLADAIVVAPATINTVCKWAAGTADNLALSILFECMGIEVPIVVAPNVNPALARHPAFQHSIQQLRTWGIRVLYERAAPPPTWMATWERILEKSQPSRKEHPSEASRAGVLGNPFARPSRWLLTSCTRSTTQPTLPRRPNEGLSTSMTTTPPTLRRANEFAADVVLSGRAEALAMACAEAAGGSVESRKRAVPRVARDPGVDVGVLANYRAYRLSCQAEREGSPGRIRWPTATNLQPAGPDRWAMARDHLLAATDLGALNPIDRTYSTRP